MRFLFVLAVAAVRLSAAEGIPNWERLLDEMLAAPAPERAGEPGEADSLSHPETPHPAAVRQFLRYFSGPGRTHFDAAIKRLEPYRAMVERTFEQHGVPREMLWLGVVESGFRADARSPRNAVGMWQFIPATAERFGMTPGDRRDPVKSTRAAARYLRFLYDTFGDWNLALAAYNAGENRVSEALRRSGATGFWAVSRWLPKETRGYVPAVLAVQSLAGAPLTQVAAARPSKPLRPVYAPITLTP